jgi:hypothetical protein
MSSGKKLADQVARERQAKKATLQSGQAPLPTKDLTKERMKTSMLARAIRAGG